MKTYDDVKDVMQIDKLNLDHELVAQPEYVYDVGMAHALAISARDSHKERLSLDEITAKRQIREDLEKGSGKKPTLNEVAAEDADLQEARQKLLDLNDAVRRWEVCNESMKRRGYSLHALCKTAETYGAAITGQSERRREQADVEVQQAVSKRRRRRPVA